MTCSVFSPFEEMDPPVSLQHSESKRSKSQKCRVARDILRRTNSRSVSHSRVVFFKTTQTSCICSGGMTNSFFLAHEELTPHATEKQNKVFASKCTLAELSGRAPCSPPCTGEGRRRTSPTSEPSGGNWAPTFPESDLCEERAKLEFILSKSTPKSSEWLQWKPQRHADWGEQMTSDWLLTHSEDRKPGSDGDISYRSCAEVVRPHFSTLVPTPAYLLWRDSDAVQSFWAFESFKSSDYASLDKFSKSKIWIENHYIFYE